jgi:anaerobic selenocysteine-containing dehydrogenase
MRVEKSFCRLCFGLCGMDVTIDDGGRVVSVKGDRDNPLTKGYACVKGLDAPEALYGDKRFLRPLKRVGDRHVPIPLEQALDEIADKLKVIIAEDGAQSVAFFRGTGTFGCNVAIFSWPDLADSLGAQKYSTMTIDQSAKWVTQERLGTWPAGKQSFTGADVWLVAGSNPLVSVFSWDLPSQNPIKKLKEAKASGLKLIVVDPRRSELANFADIHLQIYPGEDAAGLINVILSNGWEDKDFCSQHVGSLDALREEVAAFSPDVVAARAGIAAEDLVAAAQLFARDSTRGSAGTGTGVDMAAFPNLAEHLYQALGVICGRLLREGEELPNPGVLLAKQPPRAEAVSPARTYESAPRSRVRGAVRLMGESATPTLAEDILTPGPGRIRALMISAANPASAIPDSRKVVEAFRQLDLLVVVEPFETETAKLADYVLPPRMLYEHADLTFGLELTNLEFPYAAYTPPLVDPPVGSELAEEGYIAWSLAKRLGTQMTYFGTPLDMNTPPTDHTFLSILASRGNVSYDALKGLAGTGRFFHEIPPVKVQPASGDGGRLDVMPEDLREELRAFGRTKPMGAAASEDTDYPLQLIPRRIRETTNTSCRHFASARKRVPFNPLSAHPEDLTRIGIRDGDECWLASEHGRIPAIAKADETLKVGVVSMTHGFGWLAGEVFDYRERGSSTSLLISLEKDCEVLQAMPRMSGVRVRIEPST